MEARLEDKQMGQSAVESTGPRVVPSLTEDLGMDILEAVIWR